MKVRRTQYEPGNGSRYDLSWYSDEYGYLVATWWHRGGSGGSTIRVNKEPSEGYVMEKMGLPERLPGDVAAITEWLCGMVRGARAEAIAAKQKAAQEVKDWPNHFNS